MKTCLGFLLLAMTLHGQQIAGKVVNSVNGEPVRRAVVIARAQDAEHGQSYAAETDAKGQFTIAEMAPGSYLLSADRQGFHFQARGATGAPPPPLKLEPGQEVNDLVLRLIPMGVIAGRVVDEEGDPIRGAQVQAFATAYVNGKRQLNPVNQVMSNEKGEYRLFGLNPGKFFVLASPNNWHGPQQDVSIRNPGLPLHPAPAYYPGVSDEARAVPIEVAPGAELRGFDIRLSREKTYAVHVKLPSMPDQNHNFYAFSSDSARSNNGQTFSADGTLTLMNLAPGSHVITVVQQEGEKQSFASFPVEIVNADVHLAADSFLPALDVKGMVRADDNKTHPWENIRISLRADTDSPYGVPSANVRADGSFVLRHIPPDNYRMTVQLINSVPNTYVKSMSVGDHQLVDGRIDLTKETGPLNILLGTDIASIEGTVKNTAGDPVVRARVNLIPYGSHTGRADLTKFAFTDDQGEFNFKGVAPAQYRIFAWEDVEVGRPQDPAFRKRFENQSVLVKMEPNGHQKVEVTAVTAAAARKPEP
jgi:hypothetical protein